MYIRKSSKIIAYFCCYIIKICIIPELYFINPKLWRVHDVIEMKEAGTRDAALLAWVNDPARTFDLTEKDLADLAEAGISVEVMNVMLEKSEEHHKEEGQPEDHKHHH